MTTNRMIPLVGSILGFTLLLFGSLGYMGVYRLNEVLCLVFMVIGIVSVLAALAIMSLDRDVFSCSAEEE